MPRTIPMVDHLCQWQVILTKVLIEISDEPSPDIDKQDRQTLNKDSPQSEISIAAQKDCVISPETTKWSQNLLNLRTLFYTCPA